MLWPDACELCGDGKDSIVVGGLANNEVCPGSVFNDVVGCGRVSPRGITLGRDFHRSYIEQGCSPSLVVSPVEGWA